MSRIAALSVTPEQSYLHLSFYDPELEDGMWLPGHPQFSISELLLSYLERTSSMLRTHSQGMQLDLTEDSDFLSKDSDFSLPIRILPR